MRGRLWLLATLACLGLVLQVTHAHADKRVALVIGNSSYKNTALLANPSNDAEDTAAALREIGFEVISKVNADKREIDTLVARFARAARNADAALFFYAGHGMQFQGRNYIMPVDAVLEDEISLRYQMTVIDDIKAALDQSPGVKIMVLDACRNNPLAERFVRSISSGTRDVAAVRGFTRPEQTRGMVVAYSTQADDTALDGDGRNSPFTRAFLDELKEPGLEIGSMFRKVAADVYSRTKGRQVPELSISLLSDYALNQSETDRTIWGRIRTTADPTTFREFLARFPNSFYAPDARTRLDFVERAVNMKQDTDTRETEGRAKAAAEQEKRAAETLTRERDLTARLAAAETEQKRLAAELSARNEERAKSEKDAELSRRDRDRIAAETASRDKAREQDAGTRARSDREAREKSLAQDAARDQRAKEEAERADRLKAEIARLELEVGKARATSDAEQKKATEAAAAAKGAGTKVASLEPALPVRAALTDDQIALVAPIQTQMRRLGCLTGSDADWFAAPTKKSLAAIARYAKLSAAPDVPTLLFLDDLKSRPGRLCPLACNVREEERGGRCVQKTCVRGEYLDAEGDCVAKPTVRAKRVEPKIVERSRPKPKPVVERVVRPQVAPRPIAAAARPTAAVGRCFAFSGRQYCE